MPNPYYTPTGNPATNSRGRSALIRAEFTAIQAGFAMMPTMSGYGGYVVRVNAAGTALEASTSLATLSVTAFTAVTSAAFPANTTGVTASVGATGTKFATLDFVNAVSMSAVLPGQTGQAGNVITTDGTNASFKSLYDLPDFWMGG